MQPSEHLRAPLLEPPGLPQHAGRMNRIICTLSGWAFGFLALMHNLWMAPTPTAPSFAVLNSEADSFTVQELKANPLEELVFRSARRGACSEEGKPSGFPMPWAMTLATGNGADIRGPPAVRSIGIQGITNEAIYFVGRGGPGGAAGPHIGAPSQMTINASMVHLAGNYPGAGFEEQWRAEGHVREVPLDTFAELRLPPPEEALMIQMLGSDAFATRRAREHDGSLAPLTAQGRLALTSVPGDDDGALAEACASADPNTESGGSQAAIEHEARRAGLRAYAFVPSRVEMLHGGPNWPSGPKRVEWARRQHAERTGGTTDDAWWPPRQILPYSRP